MIEREFVKEKTKFMKIKEYLESTTPLSAGIADIVIERTPLGERISISAIKPGIIIGRGGKNIGDLTTYLKVNYDLENPQIEVKEILQPSLHSAVVAKRIASALERFGPSRFKALGYRSLQDIMRAGAMGAEIRIGGRGVPGAKARSWRFYEGYLKKCGEVADYMIDKAMARANLNSGTVGVKVTIMQPNTPLPDRVVYREKAEVSVPEIKEKVEEKKIEEKKVEKKAAAKDKKEVKKEPTKAKKAPAKKAPAKKTTKKTTTTEGRQDKATKWLRQSTSKPKKTPAKPRRGRENEAKGEVTTKAAPKKSTKKEVKK